MALPDGVTSCLVTYGPVSSIVGNPGSIEVRVSCNQTVIHQPSGRTLFSVDDLFTAESGGMVSIPFPHVDQSGFRDVAGNALTGWYYTIRITARFTNADGKKVTANTSKVFQVVTGQTLVDADNLPANGIVSPPMLAPTPSVTSVAGRTGIVTVDDLNAAGLGGASDVGVRSYIDDPDSETSGALAGRIAAALAGSAGLARKHPLSRFMDNFGDYNLPRVRRILITATSVGTFDPSGAQVAAQMITDRFGESAYSAACLGMYGGSYDSVFSGWRKQRYGGNQFTRLVGDPASDQLLLASTYLDTVTLEVSREADSESVSLRVDGQVVGATVGPGSQAYRQVLTATVPLGLHTVTLDAPDTGRVYAETLIVADSTRRDGVEILNYALGGTGLQHMTTLYDQPPHAGSDQHAGIPIQGNVGREAYFARDDVDLFIIQGLINSGANPEALAALDYAVEQARQRDIPVLLIIEPTVAYATSSSYQQARLAMLAHGEKPWVTVVDWHAAMWPSIDLLDATQTGKFVELYFPGGPQDPHPGYEAHQILTGMLSRILSLEVPLVASLQEMAHRRRYSPVDPPGGARPRVKIDGRTYDLGAPEGTALAAMSVSWGTPLDKRVPYYRAQIISPGRDLFQDRSPTWLETPHGVDRYGPYANGVVETGGVTPPNGQLYRATARIGVPAGAPNSTVIFTAGAGTRIEDDLGHQANPSASAPFFTQAFGDLFPDVEPVVITWLFRVVDNSKPFAPTITGTGRIYEATCLPVDNASVPPVLSLARSSFGFLTELDSALSGPAAVVLPDGSSRRYTRAAAVALEAQSATAADDFKPGILYRGEMVAVYRDTSVPQLAKVGGSDANAWIAIAPDGTDAFGPYRNTGNFTEFGWTGKAGRDYSVLVKARGITAYRAGGNGRIVANGVVVGENAPLWWFYNADVPTRPPFFAALRVRALADGQVTIGIRDDRCYEIHVVEADQYIKTT